MSAKNKNSKVSSIHSYILLAMKPEQFTNGTVRDIVVNHQKHLKELSRDVERWISMSDVLEILSGYLVEICEYIKDEKDTLKDILIRRKDKILNNIAQMYKDEGTELIQRQQLTFRAQELFWNNIEHDMKILNEEMKIDNESGIRFYPPPFVRTTKRQRHFAYCAYSGYDYE